jgi:hypothetical protein
MIGNSGPATGGIPSAAIPMTNLTQGNHVGNAHPPKPKVDCGTQSEGMRSTSLHYNPKIYPGF